MDGWRRSLYLCKSTLYIQFLYHFILPTPEFKGNFKTFPPLDTFCQVTKTISPVPEVRNSKSGKFSYGQTSCCSSYCASTNRLGCSSTVVLVFNGLYKKYISKLTILITGTFGIFAWGHTESLWQSSDDDSVINPPVPRFASQHWIIQLYHVPWAQTAASRASSEGQEHVLQPKSSQIPWFSPYSALRAISRFSPCCFVSKQQVWTAQRAANKR